MINGSHGIIVLQVFVLYLESVQDPQRHGNQMTTTSNFLIDSSYNVGREYRRSISVVVNIALFKCGHCYGELVYTQQSSCSS